MKRDYNSIKNQEIKGRLVDREVVHCCSTMISELLDEDTRLSEEARELFYSQLDYETAKENYLYSAGEDEQKELREFYEVEGLDEVEADEFCNDQNIDPDYSEPYEFWIVTDWFGEKLRKHGQIVEDFMGFTIWGRQTTGQAILLDYVISQIAEDMEILEGMDNEW